MLRIQHYIMIIFILLHVHCEQQQGPQPERWWRRLNQKSPTIYAMVAPRDQFQQTEDDDDYLKNTATGVLKSERKSDDSSPHISSSLRNQITQKLCPQSMESTRTVTQYMGERRPTIIEETHKFNILYQYMEERISNLTLLYHSERTQNIELTQEVEKFHESNTELVVYMDMLEREIAYLNQKIKEFEENNIKNQNNYGLPVNGHINGIPISIQNGIISTIQNKFPSLNHHSMPIPNNGGYIENVKNSASKPSNNIVAHSGLSPNIQNDGEIKFQNGQIIKFQNGQIVAHSGIPTNNNNGHLNNGEQIKYQNGMHYNIPNNNDDESEMAPASQDENEDNNNYEIHSHLDLSNYNFNTLQNYDNINFNTAQVETTTVKSTTTKRPTISNPFKPSSSIPIVPTVPPIPEISETTSDSNTDINLSAYSATNIAGMSLYCSEFRSFKVCSDNEALLESVMALLIYADQRVEQ